MSGIGVINKPRRLTAGHLFIEEAVEKGIADVELIHGPPTGGSDRQDSANGAWFHNRTECVGEVHAGSLSKAPDHPARFVANEGSIGAVLVAKDPLSGDDTSSGWLGKETPGFVCEEGVVFLLHGSPPVQITERGCDGVWNRRDGHCCRWCCGHHSRIARVGFNDAGLRARLHVVTGSGGGR